MCASWPRLLAALLLQLALPLQGLAEPCDGLHGTLDQTRRSELAPLIAGHLSVHSVEVLGFLEADGWRVIDVQPPATDAAHLVYAAHPREGRYLELFAGAYRPDEGAEVEANVKASAPGIPDRLARCFAWCLTSGGACQRREAANRRYFETFAGYQHPFRLVGELTEAAAHKRMAAYYVGSYDGAGRLLRVVKWYRQAIVAEYRYRYAEDGRLVEASGTNSDGVTNQIPLGAAKPAKKP